MKLQRLFIEELMKRGSYTVHSAFGHKSELDVDNTDALKAIRFVPDDTLKVMIDNIDSIVAKAGRKCTFGSVLKETADLGLMVFAPYVTCEPKHRVPMLVLRYNRYVHLFRNQRYQVSYTYDGIGEYQAASWRVDSVFVTLKKYCLERSTLCKSLFYMNLINCCKGISAFDKLLATNPEVVDEFMNKSATMYYFRDYDLTYRDLLIVTNCHVNKEMQDYLADGLQWRIPCTETMDLARLSWDFPGAAVMELFDDNSVKISAVKLPCPYIDLSDDEISEIAEFEWSTDVAGYREIVDDTIYSNRDITAALVAFLLNLNDFVVNYMAVYPTSKGRQENRLKALNRADSKEFKNLGVV